MELTPELFETTEFAERRKGYDIEQVETFMEQAGTALAQMLARVRHTEERAAAAEARLSQAEGTFTEAEERVRRAESRVAAAERAANEASQAAASAQAHQGMSEDAEVEQAAKTLLMAKRTAEATVNEARGQAQSLLEEAQSRSRRQLDEAGAEATELVRRAGEQAEAEYADRRAAAIEQVETLEGRRAQLADVIGQLESRLAGYREELARAASEITGIAEDPERLGARPTMTLLPDEVLAGDRDPDDVPPGEDAVETPAGAGGSDAGTVSGSESADGFTSSDGGRTDSGDAAGTSTVVEEVSASPDGGGDVPPGGAASRSDAPGPSAAAAPTATVTAAPTAVVDGGYVDLTESGDGDGDRWGPGSWAQVEAELASDEPIQAEQPDDGAAPEGATTGRRDRFMDELDSAVNEAVDLEDDDAMTAFFEGSSDTRARRFGWRR